MGSGLTAPAGRSLTLLGMDSLVAPDPDGEVEPGPVPTFSVVIAAWQAAGFVHHAVESALGQDPPPLEVVVCDDGSTDDLAGALRPFGDGVELVRIEHGGEAAAKNAAARAASGDFIAVLDADDVFLPGRLRAMGNLAAARPDLDVLTTDALLTSADQVLGRCYHEGHTFEVSDQRVEILRRNFVLGLAAVRRDRFLAVGGYDPAIAYTTDWDLWIRLILDGSKAGAVLEPLAEYRMHEASMSVKRAAMSRGRVTTLAKAAARSDLRPREREAVEGSLRSERARLAREELKDALLEGRPEARRLALKVVASGDQAPPTRVKALASAAVPAASGRRLRKERQGRFLTVGDAGLPRG